MLDTSALPEADFVLALLRHQASLAGTAEGGTRSAFPPCPEHPNRELEGFCQTCDVLVCSSCVMFGHKSDSHT
jgi:hypothetical protein